MLDVIRAGFTYEEIEAEIMRKDRVSSEHPGKFASRMIGEKKKRQEVESPIGPDGEIDMRLEEWSKFAAAYKAEWPRFDGDYSFLNDWMKAQPFKDATLSQLLDGIRKVRANPESAKHANKFSLLASAIREAIREAKRGQNLIVPRQDAPEPKPIEDDGRPDDECSPAVLILRHGHEKTAQMMSERRRRAAARNDVQGD